MRAGEPEKEPRQSRPLYDYIILQPNGFEYPADILEFSNDKIVIKSIKV